MRQPESVPDIPRRLRRSASIFDTREDAFVSFPPPEAEHQERPRGPGGRRMLIRGQGRPVDVDASFSRTDLRDGEAGLLVQPSKVQPPTLREDTLSRSRLLDWLNVKVHHRVVLVAAEAGYGKTTLLADFSARTRLRTLWYRLDHEDRDWVTFMRHLVASGAEHDASFAPATQSLLSELSVAPTGPRPETVAGAYLRDLRAFADEGAVMILDDVHLVDDVPEIRQILRGLVTRSPERITVVLSSRRAPSLPLARLRTQGEVADLSTDDLRFSEAETERLFREAYRRPLEADVLADLTMRTDGWVASLALVETAIRDRSPAEIRAFVRQLTGAEGDIHDYLAEEILSELPAELQAFLMRSALLQSVDLDLAGVAADITSQEARQHLVAAEQMGLLHRRGRSGGRRFHPLVREFLIRRLADEIGQEAVAAIHVAIADAAGRDWRIAAHHLSAAGAAIEVQRLIEDSMTTIAGTGEYALAHEYLSTLVGGSDTATTEVIRSRTAYWRGHLDEALQAAEHAVQLEPRSDAALLNRASLSMMSGNMLGAVSDARQLKARTSSSQIRELAEAIQAVGESSRDGSVQGLVALLHSLATEHEKRGHLHFAGVGFLDSAVATRYLGDVDAVFADAHRAALLLEASSAGPELLSARIEMAWVQAARGELSGSRRELDQLLPTANAFMHAEILREGSLIELWFGSVVRAEAFVRAMDTQGADDERAALHAMAAAELALRQGRASTASDLISGVELSSLSEEIASKSRRLALRARVALELGHADVADQAIAAVAHADRQEAILWQAYTRLIAAIASNDPAAQSDSIQLMPLAANLLVEMILERCTSLNADAKAALVGEARRLPERWLTSLRQSLDRSAKSWLSAEILSAVGTGEDVDNLQAWEKAADTPRGGRGLAKRLARRVALRATIRDLGRVEIQVGERRVDGAQVRRKVLSLLCYLAARPQFSATRDQVIDVLWPDLDPSTAVNSLHQTVYFLRRIFEPKYREDTSPGYVHFSSELIWLDPELVSSQSSLAWSLIRALPVVPTFDQVLAVCDAYSGPFAIEFSYEEWASTYRDSLHASYLHVVEGQISRATATGEFDRGVLIARRALGVDSDADGLEVSLIRLYRMAGAFAAAAEQYAHYAAATRELLGVDPPPLDLV